MTARLLVAPAAIVATLIVAAVAWWTSEPSQEERSQVHAARTQVEDVPPLRTDDGFSDEELWAHMSDEGNSDLASDLFAELAALGADVVRADATGDARGRWPDYWPVADAMGRADPCCTRVEIHATSAFRDPKSTDRVRAVVIWSGWHGQTEALVEVTSTVLLAQRGGNWFPVHP